MTDWVSATEEKQSPYIREQITASRTRRTWLTWRLCRNIIDDIFILLLQMNGEPAKWTRNTKARSKQNGRTPLDCDLGKKQWERHIYNIDASFICKEF